MIAAADSRIEAMLKRIDPSDRLEQLCYYAASCPAQCRQGCAFDTRARLDAAAFEALRDAQRSHEPRVAFEARPRLPQAAGATAEK